MSEAGKTLTFVAAGALAVAGAYFINSETAVVDKKQLVGQYLNQDIDVAAPKRLRIAKFDRQTASVREFEVAEVDGVWSIPSKQDYPADATRQMAEAATALMDRKILRVAAETAAAHADLGVVDPLSEKLDAKATGVGTRVVMTDSEDKDLIDMIIGKPVKDAEGQRYVRRSNQNVVYVVELDPASLSTNFDDWIEDDLLKLNPFDIRKLFVNDYSADLGFVLTPEGLRSRVSWDRRGEITLTYDNGEAKWQLDKLKKFDRAKKEMVDDAMAEDEEVDQDALGKLRSGLDDLLIVDIARKPDGLSADLKAGDNFLKDEEAFQDLIEKGFSPVAIDGKTPEILSSEGEIVCTLRDGVEYVLRFGQLQVQTESAAEGEEAAPANPGAADPAAAASATATGQTPVEKAVADKAAVDKKEGENLRRYLFVMARHNKDAVEKPKLKDLPELPKQEDKPADAPAADDSAEEAGGDGQAEAAPAAEDADDANEADDANQPEADEAPAADEAAAPSDEPKDDEAKDDAADEETAKLEKLVAERKEIEQENQRLQDEYEETLKSGEKKVEELNSRFGDWYYVISDDVYKQIHLGRTQIIKKKAAPAEAGKENAAGASDALSGLPNLPAAPATEPPAASGDAPAASDESATNPAVPPADSQ